MFYAPRRPQVVDEVFDAESVVLHLETGCYYALDASATALWGLLARGCSVETMAALSGLAHVDVAAFVADLHGEDLLEETGAEGVDVTVPLVVAGPPFFERFTDMQDLLLLDPVHDIALDGDGWPVTRAAG